MDIELVDGFPETLDPIVIRAPGSTFYHTRTWISSLDRSCPVLRAGTLVARSGDVVVGCLPFFRVRAGSVWRLWSMPFGTYGGPVSVEGPDVDEALLESYAGLRTDLKVHEVGLIDFSNRIRSSRFPARSEITHVLDLTVGFEALWENGFEKSKRRQTRKAQREGIRVREATDRESIDAYYQIYIDRCDGWGQHVRYPIELFYELMGHEQRVRLFVAEQDGRTIGGHLNFYFKDSVIAWNGVTTEGNQGANASTLLYAHCIRDACENGYHRYNLGSSLGKESLVMYKRSLGATPYQYRVLQWRSIGGRIASALMRVLPRRSP